MATSHSGKDHTEAGVTDAEIKLVQGSFDAINERLERDGDRPTDLNDPAHVSRYNLETLAQERAEAKQ